MFYKNTALCKDLTLNIVIVAMSSWYTTTPHPMPQEARIRVILLNLWASNHSDTMRMRCPHDVNIKPKTPAAVGLANPISTSTTHPERISNVCFMVAAVCDPNR